LSWQLSKVAQNWVRLESVRVRPSKVIQPGKGAEREKKTKEKTTGSRVENPLGKIP